MKIIFVGGGTLGPVTPLLAVLKAMRTRDHRLTFAWIGTPEGPERALIEKEGIDFFSIPVVKIPRYLSWQWLTLPFAWAQARSQAAHLIKRLHPAAVVTAGGFTAVPIVFAAAKAGVPCFAHQLDLIPGMANKRIASHCASVTTSFEYEIGPFGDRVTDERIATPTRFTLHTLPSRHQAIEAFGLKSGRPVTLVFGGGTGAQALNEMVDQHLAEWLLFTQVIHVTGLGKEGEMKRRHHGYVHKPFLTQDMLTAYAAADVVVCRGGMGALSEIAALKKTAVIVPIPKSHQEANASAFEEQGAAVVIQQTAQRWEEELMSTVKLLLADNQARKETGERAHTFLPTDDGAELAARVLGVLEENKIPYR